MPVIGAVITLASEAEPREAALGFLRQHPAIGLGEPQVLGVPVVIESHSRAQERAIWDQLEALPGVLFASVVYTDFSDIVEREDS